MPILIKCEECGTTLPDWIGKLLERSISGAETGWLPNGSLAKIEKRLSAMVDLFERAGDPADWSRCNHESQILQTVQDGLARLIEGIDKSSKTVLDADSTEKPDQELEKTAISRAISQRLRGHVEKKNTSFVPRLCVGDEWPGADGERACCFDWIQ